MLNINLIEKKTTSAALAVGKQQVSEVSSKLIELGIYDELKALQRALVVSDGRLTRIVRKVISCAYETHDARVIDDLIACFKAFKSAKFAAAIKATCEGHAFIAFENGRAAIKDYGKKSKAEKALSAKTFGVLLNYEQAQQALAAQRALERKQSVIPLDDLRSPKGAVGILHNEFSKLYDKKSNLLKSARAMAETNKNKQECIAFLERQTQVCRVMSLLLNRLESLPAEQATELLQKIEGLNA